ncbi:hypothetical protein EC957_004552 [Mortierella hygrophila]|uniref:Uncharacterized protein n=1 Tax=Mortierella hygrophila TaxID=979708 RepID=A0A9P6FER2_9FUNG|nr:hypothetical protein EC957_004552 [Mortierella hygrophila]
MSKTITLQEYRELQQREREREQDNEFNKSYIRKKSISNTHLPSPPHSTTMYTAEAQLMRTNTVPHVSASTLPSATHPSAAPAANSVTAIVTTSGPASSSFSTISSQQKLAQNQQQILAQMQQQQQQHAQQQHAQQQHAQQQHAQQELVHQQLHTQQQQASPTPFTPIYTIDAFITRYAHKLQSLDHSIKGKVLTAGTLKSDPSQDQRRRELYSSIGSYEAKLLEYEDKIEKLFRLKICNGK